MKERPILFSGPMVRAILDGRKTQTRRIVKPDDVQYDTDGVPGFQDEYGDHHDTLSLYRYGRPGDRLWVKEAHALELFHDDGSRVVWKADMRAKWIGGGDEYYLPSDYKPARWRPSIHMHRWTSRITLEITSVRVERLQDISEEDARAEGCYPTGWVPSYSNPDNAMGDESFSARDNFAELWESLNGAGSWEANPWVWAITFRRIQS